MSKSNVIRVSIGQSISAKGYYFDHKGNHYSLTRQFQSEDGMHSFFNEMREERDCDFQLVIERNYSVY